MAAYVPPAAGTIVGGVPPLRLQVEPGVQEALAALVQSNTISIAPRAAVNGRMLVVFNGASYCNMTVNGPPLAIPEGEVTVTFPLLAPEGTATTIVVAVEYNTGEEAPLKVTVFWLALCCSLSHKS
jgi:hypothetical protein